MDQDSANRLVVDDFTEEAMVPRTCERSSCNKILQPGTARYPVENRHGTQRWYCKDCYLYFKTKPTTLNTKTSSSTIADINTVNYQAIRNQNSSAQRYAPGVARVQAIGGQNELSMTSPGYSFASNSHGFMNNAMALPNIGIPRGGDIISSSSIQNHQSGALLPYQQLPGYTSVHRDYNSRKAALAAIAYKAPSSRSMKKDPSKITYVLVHAGLHYETKGKIKTQLVHNVHKGLPDVPAHIGTLELKQYIYEALMPLFVRETKFSIPINELRLVRHPAHEDLEDNPKSQDAIWPFFEKSKRNSGISKSGLELRLVIGPDKWLEICEKVEQPDIPTEATSEFTTYTRPLDRDLVPKAIQAREKQKMIVTEESDLSKLANFPIDMAVQSDVPAFNAIGPNASVSPSRKRSHTAMVSSPLLDLEHPKKKLATTVTWKSPDRAALTKAFARSAHTISSIADLETSLSVELIPIPQIEFNDLVQMQNNPIIVDNHGQGKLLIIQEGTLGSGSFKTCHFARLFVTTQPVQHPIPWSSIEILVAKRFYRKLELSNGASTQVKILRTPGVNDCKFSVREGLSLLWADSLMKMTYSFIESIQSTKEILLDIPKVHFVNAVIARSRNAQGHLDKTVIIEQYIDPKKEGHFRKFILNAKAVPIVAEGDPDYNLSQFLCFVQHIQWNKTGGLAFVSDFQGGNTLLTDPQIMTHPRLEAQFGEGNVPECFMEFADQHICNHYCDAFELSKPLPYTDRL